jgi:hypothetical protein
MSLSTREQAELSLLTNFVTDPARMDGLDLTPADFAWHEHAELFRHLQAFPAFDAAICEAECGEDVAQLGRDLLAIWPASNPHGWARILRRVSATETYANAVRKTLSASKNATPRKPIREWKPT